MGRTCLAAAVALVLGCSSTSSGAPGGAGGNGGTGGEGGRGQIPSEEARTPEECEFLGGGGSDAIPCDYVTVDFSTALPTAGLGVEVMTSAGDTLTPEAGGGTPREPRDEPTLFLSLDETETQATGFTITRMAKQPHYAPAEIAVLVAVDETVIADTTLEPSYRCVELTSDDWCWQGAPLSLDVSP